MRPDNLAKARANAEAATKARREDLEFIVDDGATVPAAALRLDLTEKTLYAWCFDNAPDLWARLRANEDQVGAVRSGRVAYGRAS